MVGSSKILTVSYGTFSCTLEGFDDSFDTMKAIAEYFRDLAADDRYFGAEPPTPDAEMLARIAEREVSRRVEARTETNGIVLRAGNALAPMAQPAAARQEAPSSEEAPEAPRTPQPKATAPEVSEAEPAETQEDEVAEADMAEAEPVAAEAPQPTPEAAPAPETVQAPEAAPVQAPEPARAERPAAPKAPARPAPEGDSVAAKLQRIRAVVGRHTGFGSEEEEEDIAPAARQKPAGMFDTTPSPAQAPEMARPAADAAPAPTAEAEAETAEEAPAEPTRRARVVRMRKADFERAVAKGEAQGASAEDEAQQPAPEQAEEPAAAEDVDADIHALLAQEEAEAAEVETQADDEADHGAEPVAETAPEEAAQDGSGNADLSEEAERALLAELAALEREMGLETEGPATQEISGAQEDRVEDEAEAEQDAAEQDAPKPDAGWDAAWDTEDSQSEASPDAIAAWESWTAPATDRGETHDEAHDEAIEAAIASISGDFGQAEQDEQPEQVEQAPEQAEARTEDEAAETASEPVASETETGDDAVETASGHGMEQPPHGAHRALETDEADMSRILSATDARMADPESGRRRESISQLKAAVAATEAARQLGDVERPGKVEEAFRDDLRQVVRPRRPARPDAGTEERHDRARPAPLKLVAAQRVDLAERAPQPRVAPVRPRRVSVSDEPAAQGTASTPAPSESFAAFAARMGAQELGELLEAAAAYTAFVEGAEDFSRPQLMERVREASPEPITREDGLRSFGTLLRQGALTRVRSGRFSVAPSSRFNPERRAG